MASVDDEEEYRATRKLYGVDKDFKEMTIEEAKEITKLAIDKAEEHFRLYDEAFIDGEDVEAIKTILTALNNSVSKDEIKAKIIELETVTNSGGYPFIKKRNSSIQLEILQELLNKGE